MALKTYISVADLMDPELRNAIESQPKPDRLVRPTKANISKLRPAFDALSARWHQSPLMVETLKECRKLRPWNDKLIEIPCRDGYRMRTEVYRPQDQQIGLPLVLLVHGGGTCMGGLGTDRFIAQLLCSRLGAIVLNIEYRLIPDVGFFVPTQDVYDAMTWIQRVAGKRGTDLEDVNLSNGYVACGCSAGGNLIASAMVMAAEKKLEAKCKGQREDHNVPSPTGLVMLMTGFPVEAVDSRREVSLNLYPTLRDSWKRFDEAPIVNRHVNPIYPEIVDDCEIHSPRFSLLNIPRDSPLLDHMPPFWYNQTAGLDMWQDTILLWLSLLLHGKAKVLERGSYEHIPSLPNRPQVKTDHFSGLPHTWWSVYPQVSMTYKWIEDLVKGTKWALDGRSEVQQSPAVQRRTRAKI